MSHSRGINSPLLSEGETKGTPPSPLTPLNKFPTIDSQNTSNTYFLEMLLQAGFITKAHINKKFNHITKPNYLDGLSEEDQNKLMAIAHPEVWPELELKPEYFTPGFAAKRIAIWLSPCIASIPMAIAYWNMSPTIIFKFFGAAINGPLYGLIGKKFLDDCYDFHTTQFTNQTPEFQKILELATEITTYESSYEKRAREIPSSPEKYQSFLEKANEISKEFLESNQSISSFLDALAAECRPKSSHQSPPPHKKTTLQKRIWGIINPMECLKFAQTDETFEEYFNCPLPQTSEQWESFLADMERPDLSHDQREAHTVYKIFVVLHQTSLKRDQTEESKSNQPLPPVDRDGEIDTSNSYLSDWARKIKLEEAFAKLKILIEKQSSFRYPLAKNLQNKLKTLPEMYNYQSIQIIAQQICNCYTEKSTLDLHRKTLKNILKTKLLDSQDKNAGWKDILNGYYAQKHRAATMTAAYFFGNATLLLFTYSITLAFFASVDHSMGNPTFESNALPTLLALYCQFWRANALRSSTRETLQLKRKILTELKHHLYSDDPHIQHRKKAAIGALGFGGFITTVYASSMYTSAALGAQTNILTRHLVKEALASILGKVAGFSLYILPTLAFTVAWGSFSFIQLTSLWYDRPSSQYSKLTDRQYAILLITALAAAFSGYPALSMVAIGLSFQPEGAYYLGAEFEKAAGMIILFGIIGYLAASAMNLKSTQDAVNKPAVDPTTAALKAMIKAPAFILEKALTALPHPCNRRRNLKQKAKRVWENTPDNHHQPQMGYGSAGTPAGGSVISPTGNIAGAWQATAQGLLNTSDDSINPNDLENQHDTEQQRRLPTHPPTLPITTPEECV